MLNFLEAIVEIRKYPGQPRDERGRWTSGGGSFDVKETKTERERRINAGWKSKVTVDAKLLQSAFERDRNELLPWAPGRTERLRSVQTLDAHPRVGVVGGRVGVDDGRHRIAMAASRGHRITVAVEDRDQARALRDRIRAEGLHMRKFYTDKVSKEVAEYQDHPNGAEQCAVCTKYIIPNLCKGVEGDISPAGWCQRYAYLLSWIAPDNAIDDTIEPIIGSKAPPGLLRSELAKTGDPLIDALLDIPLLKFNIDHALVDRYHTIPYGAGGSVPLEDPTTFLDEHVPQQMTVDGVTFDPAEPYVIHENLEQFVMQILMAAGMSADAAYRVAHYLFAEIAERAWYMANGIEKDNAEKQENVWLKQINHENPSNPPANLYNKPYSQGDVYRARFEQFESPYPSLAEISEAFEILHAVVAYRATTLEQAMDKAGFNPGQARDNKGRWTTGGYGPRGTGRSAAGGKKVETIPAGFEYAPPEVKARRRKPGLAARARASEEASQPDKPEVGPYGRKRLSVKGAYDAYRRAFGREAVLSQRELMPHLDNYRNGHMTMNTLLLRMVEHVGKPGIRKALIDHWVDTMSPEEIAELVKAFDPDEPRDNQGRWTAGQHVDNLLSIGSDEASFNVAHDQIAKLPKEHVDQIARDYANRPSGGTHQFRFRTKGDALDFIRRTFIRRSDDEAKGHVLDRLFGKPAAKAFNPDEPRDERGEWTSGGSSDGRMSHQDATSFLAHMTKTKLLTSRDEGRTMADKLNDHAREIKSNIGEMKDYKRHLDSAKSDLADAQARLAKETDPEKREDIENDVHEHTDNVAYYQEELTELESDTHKHASKIVEHLGVMATAAAAAHQHGRASGLAKLAETLSKAFNPDEPRDAAGKWTAAGGGADDGLNGDHLDKMSHLTDKVYEHANQHVGVNSGELSGHAENLRSAWEDFHDAQENLDIHHEELASETDPERKAELASQTAEYEKDHKDATKALDRAQRDAESEILKGQRHLSKMASMSAKALADYEGEMQKAGFTRVAKVFDPNEPRDYDGRWTSGEGKTLHHLEPGQAAEFAALVDRAKLDEVNSEVINHKDSMESHADDAKTSEHDYLTNYTAEDFKSLKPGEYFDVTSDIEEHKEEASLRATDARDELDKSIRHQISVLNEMDRHLDRYANENYDRAPVPEHPHEHLAQKRAELLIDLDDPVLKDLTATDVHQPTALGNEGARRRRKDFLTTIADMKGGAKTVKVPDTVADADISESNAPIGKAIESLQDLIDATTCFKLEGVDVAAITDPETGQITLCTLTELNGMGFELPDIAKDDPPSKLKPIDDDRSHTPFPYDAGALGNLRPDQVPRFFGALTDQEHHPGLEDRNMRLGSMVAMQDRVDHNKVDNMRGEPPQKLPLIVRANGRNLIADGHHRLAAMHLDGEKMARVKFLDLSPFDNAVKSDTSATATTERATNVCPECGYLDGAHKPGCSKAKVDYPTDDRPEWPIDGQSRINPPHVSL